MAQVVCRISFRALLALGVLAISPGCNLGGLVGTEIEVRGGQRSLEEQVLGAYEHVGEEVYLLAGVRSVDPATGEPTPPPPMTESEQRALEARRRMEFNRDDIEQFKQEGYVGEGNDGLLAFLPERMEQLAAEDPDRHELVRAIVEEENEDRITIMRRIVRTNPDLRGEQGMETVRRILATRYRRESAPGVMVQAPDGTWTAKEGG
ncbi:MAG: DUF1318 domain-containing protein [Candidatus Brocadiia bacterium]